MSLVDLKDALVEEVTTILGADFNINVAETKTVPHSDDAAITFPNLDAKEQNVKLLESCVLYVDMRRSTELSLKHKPKTVAKLYSSFIRAMTRCATEFNGEVRGIIGDRVMIIFDTENRFSNSVKTAMLINSVCSKVLNKHFSLNELTFGIGIDFGQMLATKTGLRRHGSAQQSYRSLVWLGRPANIASKLTDQANKPAKTIMLDVLRVAYNKPPAGVGFGFGSGLAGLGMGSDWDWQREYPVGFVKQLTAGVFGKITHNNPRYATFIHAQELYTEKVATPPILMTESVFNGYKAAHPQADEITKGWFKKIDFKIDEYKGNVYGGDVVFKAFQS